MPNSSTGQKTLTSIEDIKQYFKANEMPVYFISATNFNLLGIDEWISNFKFISHIGQCVFCLLRIGKEVIVIGSK